jgi:hypothetical protein
MISKIDLEFIRGDSKLIELEILRDAVAVDISGWTLYFTMKKSINEADEVAGIKKDITQHSDPTHGKTQIAISSIETRNLEGIYLYDIRIRDMQDNVITILMGRVTIIESLRREIS